MTNTITAGLSRRRLLLLGGGGAVLAALGAASAIYFKSPAQAGAQLLVYKSPTCGCCGNWVEHLEQAGYQVQAFNTDDLQSIRKRLNAPDDLASCHIAEIDGYVVEGHVPATSINKLLTERPKALGLFVPGMPRGSPGMEGPYGTDSYDVILVASDGSRSVFDHFDP